MLLLCRNFRKSGSNCQNMQFFDIKQQLTDFIVFSQQDIQKIDPSFHTQRLSDWQRKKYIKKVRKGYYVFSDLQIDERTLFFIANHIYAPSYISLESAFAFYHLIPESVYSITSVTSCRKLKCDLEGNTFSFSHLKNKFFFGYELQNIGKHYFMIAEVEKAILDFLYINSRIKSIEDFEGLRFNIFEIREKLQKEKFQKYLEAFHNKSLFARANRFLKYIEHA